MNKLQQTKACLKTKEQFDVLSAKVIGLTSEVKEDRKIQTLTRQFAGLTKGAKENWRLMAGPASAKIEAIALRMRSEEGLKKSSSALLSVASHYSNTAVLAQKHKAFDKQGLVSDVALANSENFLVSAEELARAGRIEPDDFRFRFVGKGFERANSLTAGPFSVESGKMVNFGLSVLPPEAAVIMKEDLAEIGSILETKNPRKAEKLYSGIARITESIAVETVNSGADTRHVNSLLNFSLSACERHAFYKQQRVKKHANQR